MQDQSIENLCAWLRERHDAILGSEQAAKDSLARGDQKGYAFHMRAKAEQLASLVRDATQVLAALPEEPRLEIRSALMRFSSSAAFGLKIDSLFYMSALLYRDEHPVGDPDNLQVFIDQLAKEGLAFKRA